jgi:hypothetical protein
MISSILSKFSKIVGSVGGRRSSQEQVTKGGSRLSKVVDKQQLTDSEEGDDEDEKDDDESDND